MLWLNIGKVNKFWKKMLDCEWKKGEMFIWWNYKIGM